ncbi:MAG TPA: GNAT family N-acetyltransferase [Pyrinomonadaceae bacterium]
MSSLELKEEQPRALDLEVRECTQIDEFDACIRLQREVFGLPDLEISPRRHLIVSREAGGWTLGAFAKGELVGFVHQMIGLRGGQEVIGYSHMMAVAAEYQNRGVGARLKWAQRARALSEGRELIRWTWEPLRARNAHFNLNRLGVVVRAYAVNFYGTDYSTNPSDELADRPGLDSDRLFASWELRSPRVEALAAGREHQLPSPDEVIEIPPDWGALIKSDVKTARAELLRVRNEFLKALAAGLVCRGFDRQAVRPRYLLYGE